MDATGDCKPVLGLAIDDRVAAGDGAASLRDLVDRALEDALQLRERRVLGPRRDVKSEQHLAAHRVDIGHRVRGADRAGGVRVVDDRWEEIQRLDDREVARNEIDGRIVGHIETDEQIRGTLLTAHRTQYLRQCAGFAQIDNQDLGVGWDEFRQKLFGLTESAGALINWKARHGQLGHKAENAALGAALGLFSREHLTREQYASLVEPMAEALPWLLPDRAPAPRKP